MTIKRYFIFLLKFIFIERYILYNSLVKCEKEMKEYFLNRPKLVVVMSTAVLTVPFATIFLIVLSWYETGKIL